MGVVGRGEAWAAVSSVLWRGIVCYVIVGYVYIE